VACVAFVLSFALTFRLTATPPLRHADSPRLPRAFWTLLAVTPLAALIALAGRNAAPLALGSLLLGSQTAANPVLVSALARVLPPARAGLGYTGFQLSYALGFGSGGLLSGVLYDADPLLPLIVQIALAIPVTATVAIIVARVVRGRELVPSNA
jgi:predicted MFS family arabinose efflux permease